jgi:hypothetical protein
LQAEEFGDGGMSNDGLNLKEKNSEKQKVVESMDRIRRFKSGKTRQEVYGTTSYQDGFIEDCKMVAEWYSFRESQE